jgi:outer membrane protein assembly factor BamB
MLRGFSQLTAIAAAALISHATAHGATAWTQYQGDAGHTGYSDVSLLPDASLAWRSNTAGVSGIAAADGRVFVTSNGYFSGQYLATLSAQDGAELWRKDFGAIYSVNPPSIHNGVVYLQTGNHSSDSYFRGYSVADGSLQTKTPFSAQWGRYQAPTIYDGKAYVNGGYYGGAYSYDLQTGNARWFTGLAQYDGWTPAINDKHLVAFVGGQLLELNRDTGAIQQTLTAPSYNWSGWTSDSPVLVGDTAYAVSSGTLNSFDLLAGRLNWGVSGVTGRIAVDGDEIFALRNGTISSINALNGSVNWMWEDSAASSLGSFMIATNNLLIVSGGSKTYLLDRHTRQLVQTLADSGQIALGNDQLYIASGSGLAAYNITAVPEAGTAAMFLLGFAGLALVRARKHAPQPA